MTAHFNPSPTLDPALRLQRFKAALARLPLVAILRGIAPSQASEVGLALQGCGFGIIEVPLNSPSPFDSITGLRATLDAATLVGAGTVRTLADVARLQAIGADLVVMPHADLAIIRAAKAAGLVCVPGVATPTEAFAALDAGADALKIFPAELAGPAVLKAMRAVLPPDLALLPVGGITPAALASWWQAGASGFGLGSALYAPGRSTDQVAASALDFIRAWQAARAGSGSP